MKYRDRNEIAATILKSAINGNIKKTKIMYGAYLSYIQCENYLNSLTASGALQYNKKTKTFTTTEKGIAFLNFYDLADEMMSVDASLNNNNNSEN